MHLLVITDLEGVCGVDSFSQTRTGREQRKGPAMDQLAREVNACIEGIHSAEPKATVDVWDGHGSGGLRESDVGDARYLEGGRPYFEMDGYDAMLFVGQHAMAGSPHAPLCHTYSSLSIDYYKLNGTFVGEFACRALLAGLQGGSDDLPLGRRQGDARSPSVRPGDRDRRHETGDGSRVGRPPRPRGGLRRDSRRRRRRDRSARRDPAVLRIGAPPTRSRPDTTSRTTSRRSTG